jgi:hypothetical protein
MTYDLKGLTPESWCCVDCGINTFPGCQTRIEMERASAQRTHLFLSGNARATA